MNIREKYDRHLAEMRKHLAELDEQGIRVFKLSTTERQEFKRCRRRWDYSSFSRQSIEPKRPATALWFGTGIHYALAEYYEKELDPGTAFEKWANEGIEAIRESQKGLWDDQLKELEDIRQLGVDMLDGYVTWASLADFKEGTGFKEVLLVEREFQVPIRDAEGNPLRFTDGAGQIWECHLVGRLDMIVQDFDGRLWVLDHKTSKDKLDPEILIMDDQMTIYLWAAQQIFGVPFEGCYYNVLRKKVPRVPPVLKSGGLSQAKDIDTTYEVYMQAIEDNGLNPDDYHKILDILQNKPNTFYQREKVRRNQHEIVIAGALLVGEAVDMLNAPYIYPNPTWDCKWDCDYKELCLATNRNDDVEWLREAMFQTREPEEGSVYDRESTIE